MEQIRIFVSHSSTDSRFCRALVEALRGSGADVWYDEYNLGTGVLLREITRELAARPVFIVVLSKAAFASEWVRDECEWAYTIYKRKAGRHILSVVASPFDPDDFDVLVFLEGMQRVARSDLRPCTRKQAIQRTLQWLTRIPSNADPPTGTE